MPSPPILPQKNIFRKTASLFTSILQVNMTGILGTILFHLIVAVVFMGASLSSKQIYPPKEILIEFPEELNLEKIKALEEMKQDDAQLEALTDRFLGKNIAVNKTDLQNQVADEISTEKYLEDLQKQMALPGFKALQEGNPVAEQEPDDPTENNALNLGSKEDKSIKKEENNYKGPTTILVDLPNRKNRYVPPPVYRCRGFATVRIDIGVNQKGEVVTVSVNESNSKYSDECFRDTALEYARKSSFSADANAPVLQKGSITYQFIAQ